MKKLTFIFAFCSLTITSVLAQETFQDSIRDIIRVGQLQNEEILHNYRFVRRILQENPYELVSREIGKRMELKDNNLSIDTLFTQTARERMKQLLLGTHEQLEIDSLVRRGVAFRTERIRRDILLDLFPKNKNLQNFYDSIVPVWIDNGWVTSTDSYQDSIYILLRIDTMTMFIERHNFEIELEKQRRTKELTNFKPTIRNLPVDIVNIAGFLGDTSFIPILKQTLYYVPNSGAIIVALVRLRAEPYFSDYLSRRTFDLENCGEQFRDDKGWTARRVIDDLARIHASQSSFREISRYLLLDENCKYLGEISDRDETWYSFRESAFRTIRNHLENEDMRAIIGQPFGRPQEEAYQKLYDWMQANYGNYKIRRVPRWNRIER